MTITADTNLLVRVITRDDLPQSRLAEAELAKAELVALPLTVLCELAWTLSHGYKLTSAEIAEAVRYLTDSSKVVVDRPAAEAGLRMMDAGGDFADGVIAHEGRWLGADEFVSFDRKAVRLIQEQGGRARLLS